METSESSVKSETVALVKRAQSGDQDAYTQLFNELHQPVLGYIYHTLHDRHAAEDVAQEAFIKAHERLGQLGPPWDFKSWIFRIASNLAIDYLRAGKRIVNVEDDVMAYLEDPPSTRRPYERRLQREEQKEQVWRSLEGLPTHYRQALVLREFNDLSYREVAQALEVSYDNARQIVHRARTKFQELHGLRMVVAQASQRCRELGDMLSAFHDGELDDDQAERVRQHLETCQQCQQEQEEIKAAGLLLAGLPPLTASAAWKAAVLEEIHKRSLASRAPATVQRPPSGESVAAEGGGAAGGAGAGGGGGSALASMMGGVGPWLLAGGLLLVMAVGAALALGPVLGADSVEPSQTAYVLAPGMAPDQETASPTTNEPAQATSQNTQAPTITATLTPKSTLTPTLGPPMAEALQNSNCRAGPSAEQFPSVADLLEGVMVPIDGRSSADNYWWVEQPDGVGHCYVWKQLVQASGDLANVPFVNDPPTPTPVDEQPPSVSIDYSPRGSGRPTSSDQITFSAQASDSSGIAKIEIWINGPSDNAPQLARSCSGGSCALNIGPFTGGSVEYFARAFDEAGNQAQTSLMTIRINSSVN